MCQTSKMTPRIWVHKSWLRFSIIYWPLICDWGWGLAPAVDTRSSTDAAGQSGSCFLAEGRSFPVPARGSCPKHPRHPAIKHNRPQRCCNSGSPPLAPCLCNSLPVALRDRDISLHLYSLRDFWKHFSLCRAAANINYCFFCAVYKYSYLLTD